MIEKRRHKIKFEGYVDLLYVDKETADLARQEIQSRIELMLDEFKKHPPLSEEYKDNLIEMLRNNPQLNIGDNFPKIYWESFVEDKEA